MADTIERRSSQELDGAAPGPGSDGGTVSQSGAALFPDLVWAHYQWDCERRLPNGQGDALERSYLTKLAEFQSKEGNLKDVYWSTRAASAVALTVSRTGRKGVKGLNLHERDAEVRLHRVSDWATRDTSGVADLLQECDLLAIRVSEVLRGTTELIALRWILGVQAHLLGFIERGRRKPDEQAAQEIVESQRQKLAEVESFYHRAASKAGRIVYVSGMLIGLVAAAIIGFVAGLLLWASDENRLIILCFGAGALGALVSALSRMGKPETGKFNLDFELGRPLLRRLGFFRPFVGAIFGVALYFLLASEILDIRMSAEARPYYYGLAAFLAGFSERYTTVVFGAAEQRLAPGDDGGQKRKEDCGGC